MRIKFLKAVVNPTGDDYQEGSFLNVEDDALATKYVNAGYAEEAPDDSDPAAMMKGLVADIFKAARESFAAETKSKGPRVDAGEAEEDRRKSFGRQLQLIGLACNPDATPRQRTEADETLVKVYGSKFREWDVSKASAQVESSGPLGGYGVFPQFTTEIFKIAIESTILASRARKVPMSSNELRYPKLDQTGTNTAGTYTGYLGGVIAGWSGETKTPAQTNAKLKQGVLKAGELMGYTQLSNEFLADNSVGFEAMVTQLFSEAIAYYVDLATLVGDGVDKPVGVNTAPATLQVTRAGASAFAYADAIAMKAKLLSESEARAFWVFNKTVQPQLYGMKDGANRNIWLPNSPGSNAGPVAGQSNKTFLDLPYHFTEKTPVLGSQGDVMLIDPQGYLLGERMALEIAASPHVAFLQREMTYRFVARVAGQPVLDKPYTMLDGTNQLSTFVTLV